MVCQEHYMVNDRSTQSLDSERASFLVKRCHALAQLVFHQWDPSCFSAPFWIEESQKYCLSLYDLQNEVSHFRDIFKVLNLAYPQLFTLNFPNNMC